MTPKELFAANLKVLRTWYGHSQEEVASDLGIKRSNYSGYETGAAEPSLETLAKIQRVFKVGLDVLVTVDLRAYTQYHMRKLFVVAAPRQAEPVTLTVEL